MPCLKPCDHQDEVRSPTMRTQEGQDFFCVGEAAAGWGLGLHHLAVAFVRRKWGILTDGALRQRSKWSCCVDKMYERFHQCILLTAPGIKRHRFLYSAVFKFFLVVGVLIFPQQDTIPLLQRWTETSSLCSWDLRELLPRWGFQRYSRIAYQRAYKKARRHKSFLGINKWNRIELSF